MKSHHHFLRAVVGLGSHHATRGHVAVSRGPRLRPGQTGSQSSVMTAWPPALESGRLLPTKTSLGGGPPARQLPAAGSTSISTNDPRLRLSASVGAPKREPSCSR